MLDATAHQRSAGSARVGLLQAQAGARLADLFQSGSAKAFVHPGPVGPEIVFLNTSGGVTGGDTLSYRLDLGAGCRATGTTQTAERAYASTSGPALIQLTHDLGPGAHLDWLPQETILFDGSALQRSTRISLHGDASCLLLESVILGRAAMDETVAHVAFDDLRSVTRDGAPVLIEPLRLTDSALTAGAGILQGARAFATLALVARNAHAVLERTRAELTQPGVTGGASACDGRLVVRLMAGDGWPLRCQILRLLAILRTAPLPRVWQDWRETGKLAP